MVNLRVSNFRTKWILINQQLREVLLWQKDVMVKAHGEQKRLMVLLTRDSDPLKEKISMVKLRKLQS